MREHRWVGLGTAELTDEQARVWAGLDGATDADLALHVTQVVCLVCDSPYLDVGDGCSGPVGGADPARHHWTAVMTLAMTAQEAREWADPDATRQSDTWPRSVNLVCGLCGQTHEQADASCGERQLWLLGGED